MTDQRAIEALNAVLNPLGSHLRHYTPTNREVAIAAMRKVLADAQFDAVLKHEA